MLSKCVILWLIKSENKFQSALLRLNSWGAAGEVTSFGEGFLGIMVAVLPFVDSEINIGKWSLPCGSAKVDQDEDHIMLGEQKEMSIEELGQLGLPKWVAVPVLRILRPKELMVL